MSRPIKFRAWNKKLKMMANNFAKVNQFGLFETTIVSSSRGDWEYDVMQFTGLTDKNGKEIYEGDVVECWFGKMVVRFGQYANGLIASEYVGGNGFYLEYVTKDGAFNFSHKFEHMSEEANNESSPDDFPGHGLYEIIGNKWENPELVK